MGRYLSEAQERVAKIDSCISNAGIDGYVEAKPHWDKLFTLERRAMNSKNDKSDARMIRALIESRLSMIEEMKKRAEPSSTQSKS